MTRQQFIEEVNNWYDLIDFCNDNNLDDLCDVYDDETASELIDEALAEEIQYRSWRDIRDMLGSIDDGYDFYLARGGLAFEGLSDWDLDNYKDDVMTSAENAGVFDPDEEEEEIEELTDEEAAEPQVEEEAFGLSDFVLMVSEQVATAQQEKEREAKLEEAAFSKLWEE